MPAFAHPARWVATARFAIPAILAVALLGACATPGSHEQTRSRELQQLAQSVMTDSGHVDVKVEGDVCFVYGFVESAIDEQKIVQVLESAEGIATVRNGLQREM